MFAVLNHFVRAVLPGIVTASFTILTSDLQLSALSQISIKGTIKLENTSKLPVDSLNIGISSKDGEGE